MCGCICAHVHVCMGEHVFTPTFVCVLMCIVHECRCVYLSVWIYMFTYVCLGVRVCVCACVHVYACVHTYVFGGGEFIFVLPSSQWCTSLAFVSNHSVVSTSDQTTRPLKMGTESCALF